MRFIDCSKISPVSANARAVHHAVPVVWYHIIWMVGLADILSQLSFVLLIQKISHRLSLIWLAHVTPVEVIGVSLWHTEQQWLTDWMPAGHVNCWHHYVSLCRFCLLLTFWSLLIAWLAVKCILALYMLYSQHWTAVLIFLHGCIIVTQQSVIFSMFVPSVPYL